MIPDLDQYQLERWLVCLLDSPPQHKKASDMGAPLPLLASDTPRSFWLSDEYKVCSATLQRTIRAAVINLVRTECKFIEAVNRLDVLLRLLDTGSYCGFSEATDKVIQLIAIDAFRDVSVQECGVDRSFRACMWKHLLGWSHSVDLVPYLLRDLQRLDCVALCFGALSTISLTMTISALPTLILGYSSSIWRPLVSHLLRRNAGCLLGGLYDGSWHSCFGRLLDDPNGANTLATGKNDDIEGELFLCLRDTGFTMEESAIGLIMTSGTQPGVKYEYKSDKEEFIRLRESTYQLEAAPFRFQMSAME